LHKEDREEEIKEATKILRRQEMERLLYVALTRARHTLVLALDRHLFSPVHDRLAADSQLKFLRGDKGESSCISLDALATHAKAYPETMNAAARTAEPSMTPAFTFTPLDSDSVRQARKRASEFIRKQNPSGYEELPEPPPESGVRRAQLAPRSKADNAATLYGSWWHTLFQHFPWTGEPEQWQTAFAAMLSCSPDPDRSAREWKLFAKAAPNSALADLLSRPTILIHPEFPFLWRIDDRNCLEGMIDLLVIDPATGRALLIDWKTNRISRREQDALRERYRPQIAAYWKAVSEITKLEVEATIFATATGAFMAYEPSELATEWKRLRSMPADELRDEISEIA
jgi:ATP-dependent exoDNAse (exonuclease V) beta subunit